MILPNEEDPRAPDTPSAGKSPKKGAGGKSGKKKKSGPKPPETTLPNPLDLEKGMELYKDWLVGGLGLDHGPEPNLESFSDAEWRDLLEEEVAQAFEELKAFPDPGAQFEPPEPPDLYQFYHDLLSIRGMLVAMMQRIDARHDKIFKLLRSLVPQSNKPGNLSQQKETKGNEGTAAMVKELRRIAAGARAKGQPELAAQIEKLLAQLP